MGTKIFIFEEIVTEKFPNLIKTLNETWVQEIWRKPHEGTASSQWLRLPTSTAGGRVSIPDGGTKTPASQDVQKKTKKKPQIAQTSDKGKILKADREKGHAKYRGTKIRVAAGYLSETMKEHGISILSKLELVLLMLKAWEGIRKWGGDCGKRYVCFGLLRSDDKKC